MTEIINRLPEFESKIENLEFSMDQYIKTKYKNLEQLKHLKNLIIRYNVQDEPKINLTSFETIIEKHLQNIDITMIEYIKIPEKEHITEKIMHNIITSKFIEQKFKQFPNVKCIPIDYNKKIN